MSDATETAQRLLRRAKRRKKILPVDIEGDVFHVMERSAEEVDEANELADDTGHSFRLCIVASALCDEEGTPLFPDPKGCLASLADMPNGEFRLLYAAAERACSLLPGELDELAKNFKRKAGDSADGSPSPSADTTQTDSSAG